MKIVALIPARSGSKRILGKNTKLLAGHPLIAYTITAAQQSGVFDEIYVPTDDKCATDIAFACGANPLYRPPSADDEQDIVWVSSALKNLYYSDQFAILRPTSPFRTAATIQRAYEKFKRTPDVHSLRAVEPVKQHPGKMWIWQGPGYPITPIWNPVKAGDTPYHSRPTQSLPQVYVQNASLEIAWTSTVKNLGSISGTKVLPFFTEGYEGVDLNTPEDWDEAERIVAAHPELIPHVHA